jgi:hypothetical protein
MEYELVHFFPLGRTLTKWNPCRFHTTVSIVFGPLIVWRSTVEVIFMVWEPDLFMLIREIKPGFVQLNKIFPTLVLDGTQQIQEAF